MPGMEIAPDELKALLDAGEAIHLLDVREPEEVALCTLPGAQNIPMLQLFSGLTEPSVKPDAAVVVYCHHGIRSWDAAEFLLQQGYANVRSLAGGIDGWAANCDPSMPRY